MAGHAAAMDTDAHDDELAQPEPDELEITDNSTGGVVDDHRLEELEEETRDRADG